MKNLAVCLLGFGEVGQALAPDLLARTGKLTAWDLKFADAGSGPASAARRLGVPAAADARTSVAGADLVISAVTAAQTVTAARSVAAHLSPGAYYFDLNSCSPTAKVDASALVHAADAKYIEAAIMSPIAPGHAASPLLLGGPHAAGFSSLAHELGFVNAKVFSGKLGAASAAKMCRSVIVKGLEALMLESLLTARNFGVEHAVLDSLESLALDDWHENARYMIARALIHGRRRAEEMREAASTVASAGFASRMSDACAEWQEWASGRTTAAPHQDLEQLLDALVATRNREAAA